MLPAPPLASRFEVRLLTQVGLALWLVAALAAIWELLALQPPGSPLHAGVLAGPVGQLRGFAFALGTSALLAGLLWPMLYAAGRGRAAALLLCTGAMVHVAALAYAALRGLIAVQLLDPRADARYALYLRGLGHALTLAALAMLFARSLRSGRRGTAKPARGEREPAEHGQHEAS